MKKVFISPEICYTVIILTIFYGLLFFGLNYFFSFEVTVIIGLVIILGHLTEIVLYLTRKDQEKLNEMVEKLEKKHGKKKT